jgi:hypothetical protein
VSGAEEGCVHDPDPETVLKAVTSVDAEGRLRVILDITCRKCGLTGSTSVLLDDFNFDLPCQPRP